MTLNGLECIGGARGLEAALRAPPRAQDVAVRLDGANDQAADHDAAFARSKSSPSSTRSRSAKAGLNRWVRVTTTSTLDRFRGWRRKSSRARRRIRLRTTASFADRRPTAKPNRDGEGLRKRCSTASMP